MLPTSLKGKRIVVTRSSSGNRAWRGHFERLGAEVYMFPTIETVPVQASPELIDVLRRISDFDWVIFTSAAGPRFFKSIADALDIDISPETMPPIAVIGERTAGALKKMGYRVAFQPRVAASKNLAQEIGDFKPIKGSAILLLRSTIAEPELAEKLASMGGRITDVPVYQTIALTKPDPEFEKLLQHGQIDFLTFASPSAVRGFLSRVPSALHAIALQVPAAALGRGVEKALLSAGFKNIKTAKEATVQGIIDVMLK